MGPQSNVLQSGSESRPGESSEVMAKVRGVHQSETEEEEVPRIKINYVKIIQNKLVTFREYLNRGLKEMTGYEWKHVNSVENICKLLHSPRDARSLAVARIFYGLLMMIDLIDERSGSDLDYRWGEAKDCRFTLFPFLEPLSLPRMGILYGIMFLGALGICLGYKFTTSCYMYILPYWYIFLIDKSVWNNHSYLFGLTGILFACSSANNCYSLDSFNQHKTECEEGKSNYEPTRTDTLQDAPSLQHPSSPVPATVPFWNYFIIKFQYYILYTYAGVKKMNGEWLSGYAMAYLGHHWVFTPFRLVMGREWTELLIIHWFGCIFDLTAAFLLTHHRTRPVATVFAVSFHLMNSRLFSIGMFPWLCLCHLPLFYSVDWPTKLMSWRGQKGDKIQSSESMSFKSDLEIKSNHKWTVVLLGVYMFLQLFLPFSHFITKGYNNWTNGLYGYSWNMMVHSWDPVMTSIKIVDNESQKVLYLDPKAFAESNRWSRHADMAKQYATCIKRNLDQSIRETAATSRNKDLGISSKNISIYFDIWCAMNGRFKQRVFDPQVDILNAEWNPFKQTAWVLPLLNELTYYRPRLTEISNQVFSWSNYTDVMFIADFPGLSLDNYISNTVDNVTLTILEGTVRLTYQKPTNPPITLTRGQSIAIGKKQFHNVLVVSDKPASYMYTYTNATLEARGAPPPLTEEPEPILPLWDEALERWHKFIMFLEHVINSLLYEIYNVPMPRRIRN